MENTTPSSPVQSVQRACAVLDLLALRAAHGEAVALREVAAHLGVPVSTAHNLLKSLQVSGYVGREAGRRYGLGPRCRDLVRAGWLAGPGLATAEAVARALAASTGESVVLATLVAGRREVLLRVDGSAAVRVSADFERHEPLFRMVTGQVLAAFADEAELGLAVAAAGADAPDEGTLQALVASIRARGYAEAQTSGREVVALAVPVRRRDGLLLAALGLFLPAFRVTPEGLAALREELRQAAERISEGLEPLGSRP